MTDGQKTALDRIAKAAVESEQSTGVPAEVSAAQCILESSWLAVAPHNNCFGIKWTEGPDNYCFTHEFINDTWQEKRLDFEAFSTLADCFNAHAILIKRGPYRPAWQQFEQDHNIDAFIANLAPIYATDPAYAGKIRDIAHQAPVANAINAARQALQT